MLFLFQWLSQPCFYPVFVLQNIRLLPEFLSSHTITYWLYNLLWHKQQIWVLLLVWSKANKSKLSKDKIRQLVWDLQWCYYHNAFVTSCVCYDWIYSLWLYYILILLWYIFSVFLREKKQCFSHVHVCEIKQNNYPFHTGIHPKDDSSKEVYKQ